MTTLSPPLLLSSTWCFFGELEDTDGGAPTSFSTLEGVSAQPCQCPLGSVASILVYADVRLRVPMTHNNKRPADKVATKFHLSKPVFKIGEDVVGWFDFSGTTASCYQVTVRNTTLPAILIIRRFEDPNPNPNLRWESHASTLKVARRHPIKRPLSGRQQSNTLHATFYHATMPPCHRAKAPSCQATPHFYADMCVQFR